MLPVLFAMLLMPLSAWAQDESYFGINIDTSEDGIWVTDANASNILGDGTMSYNVTNNILTLNGINLSFTSDYFSDAFIAMVDTDHPTLTVRLVGDNTLTIGDKACVFNGWGITFTTDASNPGTLTINTGDNWGGALFIDNPSHDPINATYNNGLSLSQNGNTYTIQASQTSYGLTVGGVEVTPDNASSITGTNITGTVSYDATNNKLTLSGATINGDITYSGTEDLTIAFSGTNAVSTSDNYAIQYVGSDSELPNLAFSLTNGSTTGSLNLSSENCVINGFSDVDFGNLNLASASAQGVYYDSSRYYIMAGYGGNPNDLTITTDKYYPIWIYDPSLSNTGYPYTQLRGESTITINDNSENPGTVSFNGDHTITISNVDFNYSNNTLIVVGPSMEQLDVNLVGTSTGGEATTILSLWATTPLTFTTDESNPGSLTAPTIVSWQNFGNGQITYQNGLVFNLESSPYRETISTTGALIKIGNTSISTTGDIEVDGGTAHFNASNNTLTLTGATIGSAAAAAGKDIQVFVDDLKVVISGSNKIYGDIIYLANNNPSSVIQISKASDEASLTANNIEQFGSCTWGDGLYLSANDGNGKSVDVGYEFEDGEGAFRSYYGSIAEVTISTIPSNPLWINGIQATGGSVRGTGIAKIDFGEVGESEWDITFTPSTDTNPNNTLLLKNVEITISNDQTPAIISGLDNLIIQIEGSSYINFNGTTNGYSYGGYIISSTNPAATLTFKANETNSQLATNISSSDYIGSPSNGFAETSYENGLMWIAHGTSTQYIINPVPTITTNNIWMPEYVDGMSLVYSVNYENDDETTQNITNATYNSGQSLDIDLGKPCTVTAHVEYGSLSSTTATAKFYEIKDKTIVWSNDYAAGTTEFSASSLECTPAIQEGDGVELIVAGSSNEDVIDFDDTEKAYIKGLGATTIDVIFGGQGDGFAVLNEAGQATVSIVPPAPTIGLAEGDYPSTQENITITSDGLANTTIKYQWDEGEIKDYPATGGVPFQAGTLKAWVVYTSGETSLSSDIVSATYNILPEAGLQYVLGNDPVKENVDYVMGGTGSEVTLPTLLNPNNVSVTYASGNTAIATVAADGTVTPVGVGSTTITATSTATTEYAASEASYTLNVYKSLSHSSITVEISDVTYNGSAQTPTVIVKDGDNVLPYGEDDGYDYLIYAYKVEFANNTNAALATAETNAPTATITALTDGSVSHMEVNWYRGSTTKTFTINKAQLTVKADDKTYNVGDDIELTVSYDGFVNGETKTVLTTQPTASYGTADVSKPGSYTITASGGEAANYDFVYQPGTLTVNRQLNVNFSSNNKWATYYGTENLATPMGLQAYIVTSVEGATVNVSTIDYIPANTAVLLKVDEGEMVAFSTVASAYTGTEATSTTLASNKLKGSTSAVNVSTITGGTVYILYNDMFRRATGTIPANRGYLVVATSSNAPQLSISIGDENTTAISNTDFTDNTDKANEWYSIDGVKLNGQPQKPGLYIKNGKKVFINKK